MASIKRELTTGVAYTAIAKYSGMVVQLGIAAILARLLTPEIFGLIAIATVFINFFNILGDIGIGPAIIQNKTLSEKDISNIFSFTIYMGLILASIFFVCSWPIAAYYDNDQLTPVCQSLCLLIFLVCFTIVPLNLMFKAKRFKFISVVSFTVNVFVGVASVIAAYNGWGVYSLVLSQLLSAGLIALIYYMQFRLHFSLKPEIASLKKIFSFSVYQFLFNTVNYFGRNLDKMMIGQYLGMKQLGYYEKSYRLMLLPMQNITFVITPVLLPTFSNLQNDVELLGHRYFKMTRFLSYIAFPISVILYFCSSELILSFFGDQWLPAVPTFRILSITVGMQILTATTGAIFQSIDKTKSMFIAGCCSASIMIISFLLTLNIFGTIESVAYGYLVAQILSTIQCYYILARDLKYPMLDMLKIITRPLLISSILIITYIMLNMFVTINNVLVSLIVKGAWGVIVTLMLVQLLTEYNLLKIIKNKSL